MHILLNKHANSIELFGLVKASLCDDEGLKLSHIAEVVVGGILSPGGECGWRQHNYCEGAVRWLVADATNLMPAPLT